MYIFYMIIYICLIHYFLGVNIVEIESGVFAIVKFAYLTNLFI